MSCLPVIISSCTSLQHMKVSTEYVRASQETPLETQQFPHPPDLCANSGKGIQQGLEMQQLPYLLGFISRTMVLVCLSAAAYIRLEKHCCFGMDVLPQSILRIKHAILPQQPDQ